MWFGSANRRQILLLHLPLLLLGILDQLLPPTYVALLALGDLWRDVDVGLRWWSCCWLLEGLLDGCLGGAFDLLGSCFGGEGVL